MAKSITENLADAGTQVVKTAKSVGSNIAEGAGNAVEMAKETVGMETKNVGVAGIKDHMNVYASCGKQVGVVEAFLERRWFLFDPLRLAPLTSVVRIGTGRDAADVAFATINGNANLIQKAVWATLAKDSLPLSSNGHSAISTA